MQFPPELRMRPFSPEAAYPDGADEWRPFDHQLRRCLAGLLRGGWNGGRSGFAATAIVWLCRLALLAGGGPGWGADLAAISLIGGIIGTLMGAAVGLALADEE